MASDKFLGILTALVLFVTFSWLIISVTVGMGNEYGVNSSEIGDGALDDIAFQGTADNISSNAQSYRSTFEDGEVDDIDDATGMFATAKRLINLITAPFGLLAQVMKKIFKLPDTMINTILGLLSVALILGIWSLLRKGD